MILQITALLVLTTLVSGRPDGGYHHGPSYHAPPKYHFDYAVHDDYKGNNFGHSESRDGYKTKGHYFVHLPDGRRQDVHYTADEYGYHPVVTYSGKAHHPSYGHHGGHGGYGHHGGHGGHGHDGYGHGGHDGYGHGGHDGHGHGGHGGYH